MTPCVVVAALGSLAVLGATLPAQTKVPSPRALTCCEVAGPARWECAGDAAEWQALAARWRLPTDMPAVDFAGECVVVIDCGEGRAGTPRLALWSWEERASARLLRLTWPRAAASCVARTVVLAVPLAWRDELDDLRCEVAIADAANGAAWRSLVPPAAEPLVPLAYLAPTRPVTMACIQDAASWRQFAGENLAEAPPPPACDFASAVLLLVPGRGQPRTPEPQPAGRLLGDRTTTVRLAAVPVDDAGPLQLAVFAVPRVSGGLVVERTAAADRARHDVVERFAIAAPESALLLCRRDVALPPGGGTRCERATTAGEWRTLRQGCGAALAGLPDDWCVFATDWALLVAVAGAEGGSLAIDVRSEEGVDVLVLTPTAGVANSRAAGDLGVLLKLPRRRAQTAVVLREPSDGPAGFRERTLAVFPRT